MAEALASELVTMASWLDLGEVTVGERGDLAGALRRRLTLASRNVVVALRFLILIRQRLVAVPIRCSWSRNSVWRGSASDSISSRIEYAVQNALLRR